MKRRINEISKGGEINKVFEELSKKKTKFLRKMKKMGRESQREERKVLTEGVFLGEVLVEVKNCFGFKICPSEYPHFCLWFFL